MILSGPLEEGLLIDRPNRYRARVRMPRRIVHAFLPNPGRMLEFIVPGTCVLLQGMPSAERKTAWDLVAVSYGGQWVSVDSRLPNPLFAEALAAGRVRELGGYAVARKEPRFGHSRFDFLLVGPDGTPCLVETKSSTLVVGGWALFPDAPTRRGARHVQELQRAVEQGYRAALVGVVQREDAVGWSPNEATDPDFAAGLRAACQAGVEVFAYRCRFMPPEICLTDPVAVSLWPTL